jgi:hypothetical protein
LTTSEIVIWFARFCNVTSRDAREAAAQAASPPTFLTDEDTPMRDLAYFERLVRTVEMIARHAHYPGKQQAVEQCIEDVAELSRVGRITAEQSDLLLGIIRGSGPELALPRLDGELPCFKFEI